MQCNEQLEAIVTCQICSDLLFEPVTVSCGHTVCRSCLRQNPNIPWSCPKCKDTAIHSHESGDRMNLKVNIVLANIIGKCFNARTRAIHLKLLGNEAFGKNNIEKAISLYTKAVRYAPTDHRIFCNRAQAYIVRQMWDQAAEDASRTIELKPSWAKGYYRKGVALVALGRPKEAAFCFVQCLNRDASLSVARKALTECMQSLFEPFHSHSSVNFRTSWPDCSKSARSLACQEPPKPCTRRKTIPSLTSVREFLKQHRLPMVPSTNPAERGSSKAHTNSAIEQSSGLPPRDNYKLELSDFECSLCLRLFHEPVTTPCGHVFCRYCFERSLDHQLVCPICKTTLQSCLTCRRHCITETIVLLINLFFYEEANERQVLRERELVEHLGDNDFIPIFVCTLALPGITCPLHIFEPQYRLMLRRCLESGTRQFGMCLYESDVSFKECGCILEVQDVRNLPDGRSLINTIGGRRFRIVERQQTDGYIMARVLRLEDVIGDGETPDELVQLNNLVYQQSKNWFDSRSRLIQERIETHYGFFPAAEQLCLPFPNGPRWLWFMVAVLPLHQKLQYAFLTLISLRQRLLGVQRIVSFARQRETSG